MGNNGVLIADCFVSDVVNGVVKVPVSMVDTKETFPGVTVTDGVNVDAVFIGEYDVVAVVVVVDDDALFRSELLLSFNASCI
jgi:hypothetical protein